MSWKKGASRGFKEVFEQQLSKYQKDTKELNKNKDRLFYPPKKQTKNTRTAKNKNLIKRIDMLNENRMFIEC